jgi:hypothetical protein
MRRLAKPCNLFGRRFRRMQCCAADKGRSASYERSSMDAHMQFR